MTVLKLGVIQFGWRFQAGGETVWVAGLRRGGETIWVAVLRLGVQPFCFFYGWGQIIWVAALRRGGEFFG